jgi:hypothetical protein
MYFPWAGFMAQMALADVYIWLDDAQFSKGSFTSRIQVKLPSGRKWMSVPLEGSGSFQPIRDLTARGGDWVARHRQMLTQSFRGYTNAAQALELFDQTMATTGTLCNRLILGAEMQARAAGCLPSKILRSSDMDLPGSSSDRVLRLVQAAGGSHYITGHGAFAYLDHELFNAEGVAVSYMNYTPLPWPQAHGEFSHSVTGLDLLAAVGSKAAGHLRPACIDWRAFRKSREPSI